MIVILTSRVWWQRRFTARFLGISGAKKKASDENVESGHKQAAFGAPFASAL